MTEHIQAAMYALSLSGPLLLWTWFLGWVFASADVEPEDTDEPWGDILIIPEGTFFGGTLSAAELSAIRAMEAK